MAYCVVPGLFAVGSLLFEILFLFVIHYVHVLVYIPSILFWGVQVDSHPLYLRISLHQCKTDIYGARVCWLMGTTSDILCQVAAVLSFPLVQPSIPEFSSCTEMAAFCLEW